MSVIIRNASGSDIDAMVSLLRLLFAIEEDFTFNETLQKRGLQLLLGSDNAVIKVAQQDGIVIGMGSGQLVISTAEGAPSLLIEDVVIAEEYRGRGIGSCIVEELCGWGVEAGAPRFSSLLIKITATDSLFMPKPAGRPPASSHLEKR